MAGPLKLNDEIASPTLISQHRAPADNIRPAINYNPTKIGLTFSPNAQLASYKPDCSNFTKQGPGHDHVDAPAWKKPVCTMIDDAYRLSRHADKRRANITGLLADG